jgi:hypothetical protein
MILEFPSYVNLRHAAFLISKNPPGSGITPWGDFYLIVPKVHLSKTIREAQLNGLSTVDC